MRGKGRLRLYLLSEILKETIKFRLISSQIGGFSIQFSEKTTKCGKFAEKLRSTVVFLFVFGLDKRENDKNLRLHRESLPFSVFWDTFLRFIFGILSEKREKSKNFREKSQISTQFSNFR